MLSEQAILAAAFAYVALLFAIAYLGNRRAEAGRSLVGNPYVYALSIAVYCTAWTFYGSVGRAANTGVGFLPIYLGPTLMAALWWFVLRKIIRISKEQRITSIADFVGARYGKSAWLSGLVTVIALVGILPYISLQLKAISTSYFVLSHYPDLVMPAGSGELGVWEDTALYVALLLALFTILFGARDTDVSERHEGMVAAIAFESVVKLLAFLAVGVFVTFTLFDGPGDVFRRAAAVPSLAALMDTRTLPSGYASWLSLTFLSMMAILFLPRQFQVTVVENVNEDHVAKAAWLFPLYLLLINLFVLPIALGGLLVFPGGAVDPDTFVLTIPMAQQREGLALLVFIGGLSAATGMVIVAAIALSTMVSNDLVLPLLLRGRSGAVDGSRDFSTLLLTLRRATIVAILLLGYAYFRLIGETYALVTIGLVSFCAAAQFAPAILLGLYWKGASRRGALVGLSLGFAVWAYTLLVPGLARSGWIAPGIVEAGPLGLALLRPQALLGLEGLDPITHSVFWSMLLNVGALVAVSLFVRPSPLEQIQARTFVDVFRREAVEGPAWLGTATVGELERLLGRFLGAARARAELARFLGDRPQALDASAVATPALVGFAERTLAGSIGAASARVMLSSVVQGDVVSIDEVMEILDETSQVRQYSRQLEEKSRELEAATAELRAANERLTELDRLKDEFVSTVSHELRTPLTSIRAFSEILQRNPDLDQDKRQGFLDIVVRETERLTRLINDVLDLAKIESGQMDWASERLDMRDVVADSAAAVSQLFRERDVQLAQEPCAQAAEVVGDRDRITQVLINLLSNAAKFSEPGSGAVKACVRVQGDALEVAVEDNGPGIAPEQQARIFEKFHQVSDGESPSPSGTGLGLTISQRIVAHHGGTIWCESTPGIGTTFKFRLPATSPVVDAAERDEPVDRPAGLVSK